METYAEALNYAIPFFLALLLIEFMVSRIKGQKVFNSWDTLSSLSSSLTNGIKDVLGLSLVIVSYSWLVDQIAVIHIETTWLVYVVGFIGIDFAGYWNHRMNHKVNYFWNVHIVHHSSEEFNLACALRQSISSFFGTMFIFLVPTALLGIPTEVIAVIGPLHLFAQYWYHTRLIGKMWILEYILVTPSHHRVHHSINDIYMDKNLGQIFIVWDKIFGTFQAELDDVPCVYGVKRAVRTWNPILINFQHLWLLIQDAWKTNHWPSKFKIWFMPTGWRPADVEAKYPVTAISDVYKYQKFRPESSNWLLAWCWIQYTITFIMMMYLFNNIAAIGFPNMFIFGFYLVGMIFSYSILMDRSVHSWWIAAIQSAIGIGLVVMNGDWFLLSSYIPFANVMMIGYFAIAALITLGFVRYEIISQDGQGIRQLV